MHRQQYIVVYLQKRVAFFRHAYLHSYFDAAFVNVCKMLISEVFRGKISRSITVALIQTSILQGV